MALKSVLEIIVHLDRFKNIDLAQQGLYQLQLSCFYLQNSQKIFAIPISCISNRSVDIPQLMLNPHEIISGHIDEKLNSIKSKVFLIRYSEEKVKFNEVATFRMEMQANQNPQGLTVQLDLMFTEVPAKKPILESINQIALQKNFVILKSKQFVIANPLKGHHHYLPGLFDSDCFCNVDGIIHVVFYDYKITENEIENFVSVLFKDKKGKLKTFIGGGEIDRKYDEFITILAEVHEGIRLISESMKTNCGFSHVDIVEPLKLPLFSKDLEEIDGSFAERLISHDPYVIGEILLREVKLIAGCIYQAFMELRDMIESKPRKCCKYLKFLYEEKLLERYDDFIVKENNKIWNQNWFNEDMRKEHKSVAYSMRASPYFSNLAPLAIQETSLISDIYFHPIIFEQICFSQNFDYESMQNDYRRIFRGPVIRKIEDLHVIVLVHGFQGNSNDLKILKDYISLVYPKCFFLESNLNESKTDGDIKEMGFRLAKELISYLSEWCPDEAPHISFIGHSLGGLIIRAALPYLDCLSDRMRLFISLSSPHLGLMYSSKLLDAGMWFLKKIKKFTSLKQLSMEDYHLPEGTFLYQLSKSEGLEWFKHIVLVSSAQDDYAPFESARVEVPYKLSKDLGKENVYVKMVQNILERLEKKHVIKLDVNFRLEQSIDTIIGRSAHMQLLENQEFLRLLVYKYPQFFE